MRNRILAITRNTVPYVKELRGLELVRSVTAAIVMQQLDYWFERTTRDDGSFYKFLEPCDHRSYQPGDSWAEELGFSAEEFRAAFGQIGATYKSRTSYDTAVETGDPFAGKYYLAYFDRKSGLTWYRRNDALVDEKLDEMVAAGTTKKPGQAERPRGEGARFIETDSVGLQKPASSVYRDRQSGFTETGVVGLPITENTSESIPDTTSVVDIPQTPAGTATDGMENVSPTAKNGGRNRARLTADQTARLDAMTAQGVSRGRAVDLVRLPTTTWARINHVIAVADATEIRGNRGAFVATGIQRGDYELPDAVLPTTAKSERASEKQRASGRTVVTAPQSPLAGSTAPSETNTADSPAEPAAPAKTPRFGAFGKRGTATDAGETEAHAEPLIVRQSAAALAWAGALGRAEELRLAVDQYIVDSQMMPDQITKLMRATFTVNMAEKLPDGWSRKSAV